MPSDILYAFLQQEMSLHIPEKKNASLPSWEKGATVSENFLISLDHWTCLEKPMKPKSTICNCIMRKDGGNQCSHWRKFTFLIGSGPNGDSPTGETRTSETQNYISYSNLHNCRSQKKIWRRDLTDWYLLSDLFKHILSVSLDYWIGYLGRTLWLYPNSSAFGTIEGIHHYIIILELEEQSMCRISCHRYISHFYTETSSPITVMLGCVCKAHSSVMCEAARPISLTKW